MSDVTELLGRVRAGDDRARHELAPLVYAELKRLAISRVNRERGSNTVQPTELVNDAFMRLVGQANVDWESRSHFYGIASRIMRQILVERARARRRHKRGGGAVHVDFDEAVTISVDHDDDILAVEDALKALESVDPRQAEIVVMRFYGGMTMTEIAEALGISKRSADREWAMVKAWLRRELSA